MADNRTMEELLQAPTEGYGEAIVIPKINADHFEIKTNLLQLVQANPYHGFERENPHTHINNFKRITSTLKFRDVPNDVIKLMMFPYSLKGSARVWYDKEPPNSILTWEDLAWEQFEEMLRACPHHGFTKLTQIDTFYNVLNENDQDSLNAATGGNLLSKTTREALHIIENKSKVRYSRNKLNVSRMNTTSRENSSKSDDRIDKLADQISTLVDIFSKKVVTPATVKVVEESCVTCGGKLAYYNCDATNSNQSSVCAATGTYNQAAPQNRASNFMAPSDFVSVQINSQNSGFFQNQSSTSGTLLNNTIPNPKGEMKAITTRSGVAYEGPLIPTPKKEPDVPNNLPKSNIPYPSRLNDQKLQNATNQMEKFFHIFQDLHFDISFADALLLMPKFASTIKSLLANKDKLFKLAKILLNENCSEMLLKNLPEKIRDPSKFLIPCDFPGMDVCHALADLGASINLMPLSIGKKLSLLELTPTRMTLELANLSITRPKGVAEDVFVKMGKFYFSIDFVVVDFEADPRVLLILGRSFLRTGRALIDVYREEITLRVNDEAVTFNLNHTTRYSSTYDDMPVNRIDIIDVAREEYAQEMLCFYNNSLGGNSTSTSEPIISDSSSSLTLFEGSDFILEEIGAYLKDETISPEINHADCDPERDICLIKKLLNNDPFQLSLMDLKQGEVVKAKSSIEEPPDLELKNLPSHLEYAYLKGVDKLYVIIVKDLKVDEKEALLKVLKSHKRVIAWKIIDIKALKYLLSKQDAKPRLLQWVLLLQEFDIIIRDKKGTENITADHLSRLENPHKDVFENKDINKNFPLKTLDFMGPFSSSRENMCILMAIDYLSKWVEEKALPTNDARVVVKFLKSLFTQFETPRAIISDRRIHFCNDKFAIVMSKYGVTHRLATVYHPQAIGQVEVLNRGLKSILKRTVGENCTLWSEKLEDALWAFRTAYKTPIGCTPCKLVYGMCCHLPIELEHKAYWALKHVNFDLKTTGDHRKLQLNELNELYDQAYKNSLIYKEKRRSFTTLRSKTAFLMLVIEFYSSILV
nr:reverse transcriptase domain-containing protein [Tanacetum cinerariifolium]